MDCPSAKLIASSGQGGRCCRVWSIIGRDDGWPGVGGGQLPKWTVATLQRPGMDRVASDCHFCLNVTRYDLVHSSR